MTMKVRWLLLPIVLLTLTAIAALAALVTVMHSESALQFIVRQLPERFGSIERLVVKDVSGTLAKGVRIGSLEVEHDLVGIRVTGLAFRVAPLPLVWQSIEVRGFDLQELRIEQRVRDRPPPDRTPRFLPGLLSIWTEDARIHRTVIQPVEGKPVELRDAILSGTLYGKVARIRRAELALADLQVTAQGLLTADDPLDLEGSATATFTPAQGPRWVIVASIDGDLAGAAVTGGIREPFRAELDDAQFRALAPWGLTGEATISDLDITEFGGGSALGILSGRLTLRLDRDAYLAQGRLDAAGLGIGPVDVDIDAMYAERQVALRRADLQHPASGMRASTAGTVTLAAGDTLVDLKGRWQGFRWPLTGQAAPIVKSPAGEFTLAGGGPWSVTSSGRFEVPDLPPIDETLAGTLYPDRFVITRSEIRAMDARAALVGEVSWQPREAWRLKGPVRGLNLGKLRPDLPGSLDFTVDARGTGFGATQVIDVDVTALSGRLRGTAARGSGSVRYSRDTLTFRKVDVAAGGFRLALDGELSPRRRDLRFQVVASDLGVLAADARGSLRAEGTLRGTPAAMLVRAEAAGRNLDYQGIRALTLDADIDVDPTGDRNRPARASIVARDIEAYGQTFKTLRFNLNGPVGNHSLALDLDGESLALEARGTGRIEGDRWRQSWSGADVDLPADITLTLSSPLALSLSPGRIEAEPFCMRSRDSRRWGQAVTLCAEGGLDPAGWRAKGKIDGLPLASLLDAPSPKASYTGRMDATVDLRGSGEGPPLGTLRVTLEDAALRWQRAGAKEDLMVLGTGLLTAESTAAGVEGALQLAAGERGSVVGTLQMTHVAGDWRATPLRATLKADSTALVLLHLYVPEIDRAAGDLSLDLVIGGTLGAPLVNGVARLARGELDFYQVNLALRDLTAEARLIDNGFVLRSSGRAGEGRIAADAELVWRDREPYGELSIKGDDLLVADVPEARITASPDLRFRVAGRDLSATGVVRIPYARLVPADLTGAVLSSADEVLVGAEPVDPESSFLVSSNIRLVLGDKVTLDSFGLSGRLAGTLNVITQPDGNSRGSGELGVAEGKYAALGRRLDIERGRLVFTGGALNDPGVDIRATKEFPEVKAGVNVRGTLRAPRMTFFAEPSLPQSQIVSLLLAGGTFDSAQGDAASAGRSALIAQGGAILAQQLGQRIGIEDVGIEQNLANEASLVLGKYLSPRLYVSYGISLAEAINTFKMRYTINDRWTIKTEAGKEVSADIVYTVEKD
jgi:translocation and assembly module TamB